MLNGGEQPEIVLMMTNPLFLLRYILRLRNSFIYSFQKAAINLTQKRTTMESKMDSQMMVV